jgi:hypothetical protein
MLIKTLHFKEMKKYESGITRPSVVETESPLYRGYRSFMIFAEITNKQLADEVFTLTFLPRLDTLR